MIWYGMVLGWYDMVWYGIIIIMYIYIAPTNASISKALTAAAV